VADDRERLRRAALALRELADALVFVGGTVTSLLITDPAAPPTRLSYDIDAIVDTKGRADYYTIEARLRELGFAQAAHAPVCRWFLDDLVLDVMPDDAHVLGFSNPWYASAFETAQWVDLSGVRVRIVSPVWFVATKLAAFEGRGHGDFQASRDIEDIVAIVDGRPGLADELRSADDDVRRYVRARITAFLRSTDFVAAVIGHLAGDDARAEIVIERLSAIGGA
jgi:hypothetical protein